jgi:hypothetical protein
LQQQWLEKAGRIGDSTRAFNFENIDKEVFKAWTDIYEKEFQQFFNIPQLGLTRFYQEKFGETLDKYNRFQSQYAEFMHLIFLPIEKSSKVLQEQLSNLAHEGKLPENSNLPIEKSSKVLQEQLSNMAHEGKLPENSNDYYKLYIKILEGHYMSLFKSPEYISSMAKTLGALEDFIVARNAIAQDFLKTMAVPTQDELDELYKDLYHLKKRIRILEKEKSAT